MNNLIYNLILGICASFLYLSCSEEPIRYELEIGEIESFRLDADSLSYYQSAPEMGGLTKLYYGKYEDGGYSEIYSLIKIDSVFAPFFKDTTYTNDDSSSFYFVDTIMSVTFFLTLENADDSLNLPNLLYFSGNGAITFNQDKYSFAIIDTTLDPAEQAITFVDTSSEKVQISFRVDSIFHNYLLSDTLLNSYTFKIVGKETDPLVAFTNPKLEVQFIRTTVDLAEDTSWVDTVTKTYEEKYKLTIVNPGVWEEENSYPIGRAKGLKSIVNFNLDTLSTLSENIIFVDADLYLHLDSTYDDFTILGYPVIDSINFNIDLETKDSTKIEQTFGLTSYDLTSSDTNAVLNVRDYLNYIYLDQLENFGLQLSSSLYSNPFKIVTFSSEPKPYILIRYVRSN